MSSSKGSMWCKFESGTKWSLHNLVKRSFYPQKYKGTPSSSPRVQATLPPIVKQLPNSVLQSRIKFYISHNVKIFSFFWKTKLAGNFYVLRMRKGTPVIINFFPKWILWKKKVVRIYYCRLIIMFSYIPSVFLTDSCIVPIIFK